MPDDNTNHDRQSPSCETDPRPQLEDVRARVAALCQRIKASKDPDAIREVHEQLGQVGNLLGRKRARTRKRKRRFGHG